MFLTAFLVSLVAGLAAFYMRGSTVLGPQVSIANGTVVGSSIGGIDTFLGIPFAEPPMGPLRLKRPVPLRQSFRKIYATSIPKACPPLKVKPDPNMIGQLPPELAAGIAGYFQEPVIVGEDCLTLNIQRPATATADSKLPVVVWIYGGGFEQGSTQQYDFARFVNSSIAIEHPVIAVQMNWRVSAFGFLGGKKLQEEGNTNLGLRDQRLALEWISENIAAFGGDPSRVTLWGESSGSISSFDHTIINGGDHNYNGTPLFHGVMLNSGAVAPALPVDHSVAQGIYDKLVLSAGCGSAADTLACLRSLPYETFHNASNNISNMFNEEGIAVSYLPRPDPTDNFFSASPEEVMSSSSPKIAPVSILAGTEEDEGTVFALALYKAQAKEILIHAILTNYPASERSTLERLVSFYPDDPAEGSPFGTGDANELYPGYKRNAALAGDATIQFQHRIALNAIADKIPTWSYLSSYGKQTPFLGTFHGSDVALIARGQPEPLFRDMVQYLVSFIYYLDPTLSVNERAIGNFSAGRGIQQSTRTSWGSPRQDWLWEKTTPVRKPSSTFTLRYQT